MSPKHINTSEFYLAYAHKLATRADSPAVWEAAVRRYAIAAMSVNLERSVRIHTPILQFQTALNNNIRFRNDYTHSGAQVAVLEAAITRCVEDNSDMIVRIYEGAQRRAIAPLWGWFVDRGLDPWVNPGPAPVDLTRYVLDICAVPPVPDTPPYNYNAYYMNTSSDTPNMGRLTQNLKIRAEFIGKTTRVAARRLVMLSSDDPIDARQLQADLDRAIFAEFRCATFAGRAEARERKCAALESFIITPDPFARIDAFERRCEELAYEHMLATIRTLCAPLRRRWLRLRGKK
jgi:hypothetical protein